MECGAVGSAISERDTGALLEPLINLGCIEAPFTADAEARQIPPLKQAIYSGPIDAQKNRQLLRGQHLPPDCRRAVSRAVAIGLKNVRFGRHLDHAFSC